MLFAKDGRGTESTNQGLKEITVSDMFDCNTRGRASVSASVSKKGGPESLGSGHPAGDSTPIAIPTPGRKKEGAVFLKKPR